MATCAKLATGTNGASDGVTSSAVDAPHWTIHGHNMCDEEWRVGGGESSHHRAGSAPKRKFEKVVNIHGLSMGNSQISTDFPIMFFNV